MDDKQILLRADEYIKAEHNDFFRQQVEELVEKNDYNELRDRFYKDLEFGTGGLRGVIGGGYNRMNSFIAQRATQGVANYIKKAATTAQSSVVIAYDSRHFSDVFAQEAALVLCGNGIKTYLFSSLRPTPQLSFAVRFLHATAGIVLTASHNPPQYNGYKVYWSDGGQIVAPHDKGIIEEVLNVKKIHALSKDEAVSQGLLAIVDKEIDDAFITMIKDLAIRPQLMKEMGADFKVVYTPLHGSGAMPVSRALSELGINVIFVPEQKDPDGDFPTVEYPNPEEAAALKLAVALAEKEQADVVMATDPDADRMGIAAPRDGSYELVTGNQLGVLLADYIFSSRKQAGTLPDKPAFVKTIVTTELQRLIAEQHGARCFDTLTGFKYIAEKIREFESGDEGLVYVFGGEESYGYLVGTSVRDKDAVSAAAMTAEMALYYHSQGTTLLERLDSIYRQYGYFQEMLLSRYFEGEKGVAVMKNLMQRLRTAPPDMFAGQKVIKIKDYLDGTERVPGEAKSQKAIDLPSSNVLQFILSDGSIITARPSGTEPKIKFYASCCEKPNDDLAQSKENVNIKIEAIKMQINDLIGE